VHEGVLVVDAAKDEGIGTRGRVKVVVVKVRLLYEKEVLVSGTV
jgi:hypothetical protein